MDFCWLKATQSKTDDNDMDHSWMCWGKFAKHIILILIVLGKIFTTETKKISAQNKYWNINVDNVGHNTTLCNLQVFYITFLWHTYFHLTNWMFQSDLDMDLFRSFQWKCQTSFEFFKIGCVFKFVRSGCVFWFFKLGIIFGWKSPPSTLFLLLNVTLAA